MRVRHDTKESKIFLSNSRVSGVDYNILVRAVNKINILTPRLHTVDYLNFENLPVSIKEVFLQVVMK